MDKCPTNTNRKNKAGVANNNTNNKTNVRRSNPKTSTTPNIGRANNGIRIKHREFVTSLNTTNAGFLGWSTNTTSEGPLILMINPGDGVTFPWLSSIAPNFEHYTIHSIKFSYTSSVSSFTRGAIAIVPEYDPHNFMERGSPENLPMLLNKVDALKANVWTNNSMTFKRNLGTKKLVRSSHHTTHNAEHLRQTEVAVLYVALYSTDNTIDYSFGDLFVEYDISLMTPNYAQRSPKCLHGGFATPAVATGYGVAGAHQPLLPISQFGEADLENGPKYNGHDKSTAGVLMENIKVGTAAGNDVYATRFHFKEPFYGHLITHANTVTGASDSSFPINVTDVAGFAYDAGLEPQSAPTYTNRLAIHDSVAPKQTSTTYDINAAAGDVFDMCIAAAGTWLAEEAWVWLTDLAAGLLVA